jgi:tRNA G18 (ribose-2'-O)-methylase SpoU
MTGVDALRLVGDSAALERAGLFVAEGRLIVERLLLHGGFRMHSVAVTPPAAAALAPIFAQRPDVPVFICEPRQLEVITGFDFHRGCLALAWRPTDIAPLEAFLEARRLVAVEGVGNPDNVGGLFRAAFAFGAEGVLLDPATGDPLYRKAIRTSMGATLQVPFTRLSSWPDELGRLRARGFRVLALTPHPDAIPLQQVTAAADDRLVIVVGSEGSGLTSASMTQADIRVRIPIDPRADSLNVVVAAGIALDRLFIR